MGTWRVHRPEWEPLDKTTMFKNLRLLTVVNIFIKHSITLACVLRIKWQQEVHTYGTRHRMGFNLPAYCLKLFEGKPSHAREKFFNALPSHFKSLEPIKLKRELKYWLLKRPFYSVSEYLTRKEWHWSNRRKLRLSKHKFKWKETWAKPPWLWDKIRRFWFIPLFYEMC